MASYSNQRIVGSFVRSDNAQSNNERGRLLEELVAYLFSRCPGVRHYQNNMLNVAGSSEVDVCFWNDGLIGSMDFLPRILVVECKNTGNRIGSPDVRIFRDKIHEMGLDHGIFVAANGISGNSNSLRAAHDIIRTAFQRDQMRIIVLTRAELEGLHNTEELVRLLQDKILLLTIQARTFER